MSLESHKIIDAHAHIFPGKIAQKAVKSIGDFYGLAMVGEGLSEALIQSGNSIGVSQYLVCSTATKPEQVVPINDFIYAECQKHPEFIGFATLHPDMEQIEAEVERIINRGFYGIKLHPDFQEFDIDAEKTFPIYKAAQGKLAILFHTGDNRYDFSSPVRLSKVSDKFPDLVCIAAHFGGYRRWEEAYEVYHSRNIYMDTSSSLFTLESERAAAFIEKYGASQFFFGTDFPMWNHQEELKRFLNVPMDEQTRDRIFHKNFERAILHMDLGV